MKYYIRQINAEMDGRMQGGEKKKERIFSTGRFAPKNTYIYPTKTMSTDLDF